MDNDNIIPPGKFLASVTGPSLLSTSASLDLARNTQTKSTPSTLTAQTSSAEQTSDKVNLWCTATKRVEG